MPDALLLVAALACNVVGLAWLALAMQVHWQQVAGQRSLRRGTVVVLRVLGVLGMAVSLMLCLRVNHASMASLVWVMALTAAALVVAFTLTWRPRLLAPLVVWVGAS